MIHGFVPLGCVGTATSCLHSRILRVLGIVVELHSVSVPAVQIVSHHADRLLSSEARTETTFARESRSTVKRRIVCQFASPAALSRRKGRLCGLLANCFASSRQSASAADDLSEAWDSGEVPGTRPRGSRAFTGPSAAELAFKAGNQ
jgi:hypothetical protein